MRTAVRTELVNWKRRIFKGVALICILALFIQPETWHMLFLFLDASTLDVLALLLEVQVVLAITIFFRSWLWSAAAWTWVCAREIGRALRYHFFMMFVPGSQDLGVKWGGPLVACLWLWWAARDSNAIGAVREMT